MNPTPMELMPLHFLAAGQKARIGQVLGGPEEVHRLEEMGVRQGAAIEVLQPGNTCIIRLEGQRLCFRGDEQFHILAAIDLPHPEPVPPPKFASSPRTGR